MTFDAERLHHFERDCCTRLLHTMQHHRNFGVRQAVLTYRMHPIAKVVLRGRIYVSKRLITQQRTRHMVDAAFSLKLVKLCLVVICRSCERFQLIYHKPNFVIAGWSPLALIEWHQCNFACPGTTLSVGDVRAIQTTANSVRSFPTTQVLVAHKICDKAMILC